MADPQVFADALNANAGLDFVQRLFNPEKYPQVDNGDGTYSSHKMSWGEIDGPQIAYPTLVYDKGRGALRELPGKQAINYAYKTGEYIESPTQQQAKDLATNYKPAFPPGHFKRNPPPQGPP